MSKQLDEPLLWLNDARGIYIPRDFATSVVDRDNNVTGVKDEDWTILEAGPEHEHYWEAWEDVINNAVITNKWGSKYHLYHNGDLWLIPDGMEWSDSEDFYVWPEKEPQS